MERRSKVNNAFYDQLQEDWYEGSDHPIALLRAENAVRNPWILQRLGTPRRVLDLGCGGGLLTNSLAQAGHQVTGVDLSAQSLEVAKQRDTTGSVRYIHANALQLELPPASFDAVCAMDFLEHVEEPEQIVATAARLLKPGGLFFFHTFSRNWLSYLLVIKGVEWFVPNTPPQMHLYKLFIQPKELSHWCQESKLQIQEMHGLVPQIPLRGLLRRRVQDGLRFRFSRSLLTGYVGMARAAI
jgi:2-polyprenyl-6-hydroxyphenyl methylase / 3-demethylubiquinone-9 3-methyltransferase